MAINFIHDIKNGYSCVNYAMKCVDDILAKCTGDTITLLDGDQTLTIEDSSRKVFNYKTNIYDGNFYTGYQAWLQNIEFMKYNIPLLKTMPVTINQKVLSKINGDCYILTSGNENIWSFISKELGIPFYCGIQMSAETKLYITKLLRTCGKKVIAYGDGMNDYYMLKNADIGYLVTKQDGTISKSLKGRNLEGLINV
jgi:hydroxymethylpyrimidine pyrophosphatase-like HAD family hydrolase